MKLFCKHNYEIIDKYQSKTTLDKILDKEVTRIKTYEEMDLGKLIIIYKCAKCNKIKESVFNI